MISIKIEGDPELVCGNIAVIIAAGNDILGITKTRNNSSYIVSYVSTGPGNFILKEDGSFLLLESGDKIIVQL